MNFDDDDLEIRYRGEMREQEKQRLRKLARKLDLDWMDYDLNAYSYAEVKEQMLKRAGRKTEEMQDKEFLMWDAMATEYDNLSFEQKMLVPEDMNAQINLINCLVLSFNIHDYGLALKVLKARFKGNMMQRTRRILEHNKKSAVKIRMLWFMGFKETTDKIQRILEDNHNIHPRVLRDSFLSRHFLHYRNGVFYVMKTRDFLEIDKKQSAILQEEQEDLLEKMVH